MGSSVEPRGVEALAWRRSGTVYVVAVDAMTFDVIAPLAESGFLPHFA